MKFPRYLIALDENGTVHVRKTLCVIHRLELGEVHYHSKPVSMMRAPLIVQDAAEALRVGAETQARKRQRRKGQK